MPQFLQAEAPLESIPNSQFAEIAFYLDEEDLVRLGEVCKALSRKVLSIYCEQIFEARCLGSKKPANISWIRWAYYRRSGKGYLPDGLFKIDSVFHKIIWIERLRQADRWVAPLSLSLMSYGLGIQPDFARLAWALSPIGFSFWKSMKMLDSWHLLLFAWNLGSTWAKLDSLRVIRNNISSSQEKGVSDLLSIRSLNPESMIEGKKWIPSFYIYLTGLCGTIFLGEALGGSISLATAAYHHLFGSTSIISGYYNQFDEKANNLVIDELNKIYSEDPFIQKYQQSLNTVEKEASIDHHPHTHCYKLAIACRKYFLLNSILNKQNNWTRIVGTIIKRTLNLLIERIEEKEKIARWPKKWQRQDNHIINQAIYSHLEDLEACKTGDTFIEFTLFNPADFNVQTWE